MRKEAKETKAQEANIARVQGYHEGGYYGGESYVSEGYTNLYYYNSDRKFPMNDNYNYQTKKGDSFTGVPKGFGCEIETECWGLTGTSRSAASKALAEVFDKIILPNFKGGSEMFKIQSDGSLSGGNASAEVITQVMTKGRIRNEYPNFKKMFNDYFPLFGISAAKTGNRGMHVNVSLACFGDTEAEQADSIRKLYYIINKHFDLCRKLFMRTGSTGYCGQMDYTDAKNLDVFNTDGDHFHCINLSHVSHGTGRVEIRLVAGQKSFGAFRNTMESIFFLVERCRSISWADCDNIEKIFQGCNQYVYDRLESRCDLDGATLVRILNTVKPEELI